MKNVRYKKVFSMLLGGVMAFFATACGKPGGSSSVEKGEAELFSTYITDKILKDVAVEEEQKLPLQFAFLAAQGESEAAQIIMAATKNITEYEFSVSDLTCAATGETFKKENFETFHQKYIEVKSNSSTAGGEDGPLGWYPDILVPLNKAIEYGENTVKQGENQGVVVQAHIPSTQKAGLYEGTFTLKIDGEAKSIPVELQIYNTQIPDVPTFDSIFLVSREELIYGEGDNSLEMYATYCDKLIEYNCMPFILPASAGDYEGYAQQVKKYYHKISGYSIPASYSNERVDKEKLTMYLMEIVKLSLQDGVNYLSKVRNYYPLIDEPLSQGKVELANKLSKQYSEDVGVIADEIRALEISDHVNCTKEDIAQCVEQMKNIVTAHIDPQLPEVTHFCAGWSQLDSEAQRQEYYDSNVDYWWYGCNAPTNPYPTFHMDDMNNMVSTRVMGYMSEMYGVQGELFWETVLYRQTSFDGGYFHKINTDVYESPMQYPGTNGDGVLFYPGVRYGMDEPLVSNRLLAIRDAHEEFDLVRNVKNAYRENGKDATSLLEWLGASLYNGTKVHANSEDLVNVKQALLNVLAMATEKQVYIMDVKHTDAGYTFNVDAPENTQVLYNGEAVNNTCSLNLNANENIVEISCGVYTFRYVVEGKKELIYNADTIKDFEVQAALDNDATVRLNKTLTVQQIDGETIGLLGKATELSFSGEGVDYAWSITTDDFSKVMNKRVRDLTFTFYNPLDVDLKIAIRANNVQGVNFPVTEVIIKANSITETHLGDLATLKWSLHRKIDSLDFAVSSDVAVEKLYMLSATKTEVSK